jgi:D-alanyl-D-alanine carboxypeptidase
MAKRFIDSLRSAWFLRQWDKILFLVLLGAFVLGIPDKNIYNLMQVAVQPSIRELPFAMPNPAPFPLNVSGSYPDPSVSAQGIVILDLDSGVVMYNRNENESLSPASTTKILTALVALDHYQLDDVVTIGTAVQDGQVMGLVPGERITVENLLYGALIHSGNDAAWALGEYYNGGIDAFVAEMNKKAKEIHLDHSHFTNPVGYDNPDHKMTPSDLARLAAYALTNKTIAKIVAIPQITISDVTHTYFHSLTNVNQLLGKIPGVGGIKTGWTEEAGENLVTLIERNGHRVIIVVLKSANRFTDTTSLINWIFASYEWKVFTPPTE